MSSPLPVAVIGGGLGGLASACTLAARGYSVTLFEKNAWVGGKAAVLSESGYRFDMGPTILTMPGVLARIFAEAGRDMDQALDLRRLDPQWRCFFDDGSVLDLRENVDCMAAAIAERSPPDADGFRQFMQVSEHLHQIADRFFFWKSVEGLRDTIDLRRNLDLATLHDVVGLRMGATVAGTIRRRVQDPQVAQMLDHFVQYVGSSPYGSPAVLCGIAHMQTDRGVWYPIGWHPRRAGGAGTPRARPGRDDPDGNRHRPGHQRPRPCHGGGNRSRRADRCRGRRVEHGQRAHLP